MPLIIDTFEVPAMEIAKNIFRSQNIVLFPISLLSNGSQIDSKILYYIHKETKEDLLTIKYYFNEIVEVDQFILYINKQKKTLKYYRIYFGDSLRIEEIKNKEKAIAFDKTDFLPHLKAQEDELVIFPEEDEE